MPESKDTSEILRDEARRLGVSEHEFIAQFRRDYEKQRAAFIVEIGIEEEASRGLTNLEEDLIKRIILERVWHEVFAQ